MKAEVKGEIFESLDKRSADYKKKFKQMVKQRRAESNPSGKRKFFVYFLLRFLKRTCFFFF